jgi:hypothetical protein
MRIYVLVTGPQNAIQVSCLSAIGVHVVSNSARVHACSLVEPRQNAMEITANPSLTPTVHDTKPEMHFHNKQTSISAQFLSAQHRKPI